MYQCSSCALCAGTPQRVPAFNLVIAGFKWLRSDFAPYSFFGNDLRNWPHAILNPLTYCQSSFIWNWWAFSERWHELYIRILFLAPDAVVLWLSNATLWTGYHIAKALLEDVTQASIVIGELLVQIVDGVAWQLHITSV